MRRHALHPTKQITLRGVSVSQLNGGSAIPGSLGTDYFVPSTQELDAYKNTYGITLVKLPFSWERIQPTLGGALDATYLGYITTLLAACQARNIFVIPSVYQVGGGSSYNPGLAAGTITSANFADLWTRLATAFAPYNCWGYGLLNEPTGWSGGATQWHTYAQAAVTAIRAVDKTTQICVSSYAFTSGSWLNDLLIHQAVVDPNSNILWESHVYFDANDSGVYANSYDTDGTTPTLGVERASVFAYWCRLFNQRGFFGEYGVPDTDPRWLTVMENFLAYIQSNNMWATYWTGGPALPSGAIFCEYDGGNGVPGPGSFGTPGPQIAAFAPFAASQLGQIDTNIINGTFTGASTGTPGVLPTGWSIKGLNGIACNVAGLGIENGIPYMDLRFVGTSAGGETTLWMNPVIPVVSGQDYVFTFLSYLHAGSATGVSPGFQTCFDVFTSGGSYITSSSSQNINTTGTIAGSQSPGFMNSTWAQIRPRIGFNATAGAIDATFRLSGINLSRIF